MKERMLRWFEYGHLSEDLRVVSAIFNTAAVELCKVTNPGPERTVALRKLLEAKDAAVRQRVDDREILSEGYHDQENQQGLPSQKRER